ncbi:MAG: DUF3696 domain-containing protein [Anaerolineae bacterium]|nr:DUF3696 domain-containing protein [Anaerolineae bacterium]
MLTQLELRNFKSWASTGKQPVRLAPLSGLFGTNSSGKTSLLQWLLMLKQTADSPDRNLVLHLGDDRGMVELGTFQDLLYRHDLSLPLGWHLTWKLNQRLAIIDPKKPTAELFGDEQMAFEAEIGWRRNGSSSTGRMAVQRLAYRFANASFGMQSIKDSPDDFELINTRPRFKFSRVKGRPWNLPQPAKCYGFPDQVRAYFQNAGFLSDFELEFEKLCQRILYLGPLRDYPKRQYPWAGAQPPDMGRKGERVIEVLLASREAKIVYSFGKGVKRKTLEELVADWLKKLGLIDSFAVRPITEGGKLFQVWVRRHPAAQEVLLTDVGFGVSQILPVITLCYYAPPGSILLLEQPEIHLHPSVQAGLADVFIDAIKTRGIQIILESHSEHLLRRLQRRIAEEEFSAQDAALYFCAIDDKGASSLTRLAVDLYGRIENWPEDFFGDEFGEISETQKAILRRQGAAK